MNCYQKLNPTNPPINQHASTIAFQQGTEAQSGNMEIIVPISRTQRVSNRTPDYIESSESQTARKGEPEGSIRTEERDGISIVVLERDILYKQANALNEILDSLVCQDARNVLIDFRNSRYISARALGVLISKALIARSNHKDIKLLLNPQDEQTVYQYQIHHLLEITGISSVLDIFDSDQAALASFKQPIGGIERQLLWKPV